MLRPYTVLLPQVRAWYNENKDSPLTTVGVVTIIIFLLNTGLLWTILNVFFLGMLLAPVFILPAVKRMQEQAAGQGFGVCAGLWHSYPTGLLISASRVQLST